ncbi:MAG: CoA-binding protein [Promethearchaeota archaeon]
MKENYLEFLSVLQKKTRGVAIFGPSAKRGFYWIRSLIYMNFDGAIVPIHPRLKSASGIPCYKSLDEVPESIHIDYAIIAVPKPVVIEVLEQCIRRGVKVATIFTSGYSEQDPVEGRKAELEILETLEKGFKETGHRLRVLGPNCMGVYYPRNGLAFRSDLSMDHGNVGIISQSGGLAINISLRGAIIGIKFSKVVSIGNAIDLTIWEILKLMSLDEETHVVGCYVESLGKSVDDARKLLEIAREATCVKPVVIWRGGRSERGSLAASSHTGALKTSEQMWNAFVKQTGVIPVDSFDELMDTLLAFQFIRQSIGSRVGLISISGGSAVTATDDIIEEGLILPILSEKTQESIKKLALTDVGISVKNPVDLGNSYYGFSIISKTIEQMCLDDNIDILFFEISTHYIYNATVLSYKDFPSLYFNQVLTAVKKARRKSKKPIFIIMPEIAYEQETIMDRQLFLKKNVPVFPTIKRAAKVLRNLEAYRRYRERMEK